MLRLFIVLNIIYHVISISADPYGNSTHISQAKTTIATEGGVIKLIHNETTTKTNIPTHGREGIATQTNTTQPVRLNTLRNTTHTTTEKVIPVHEPETTTKTVSSTKQPLAKATIGDSKIKPRKGVMLSESTTTTTTTTTAKPKKLKPTVTVGSDDEPYPPSNFVPHTKKTHNNNSSVKMNEGYGRYFKKGPDYVLPIVLTILAVPLVAILIAFLYKRGAEWWQHRHYRRMDFLIEGIYNN